MSRFLTTLKKINIENTFIIGAFGFFTIDTTRIGLEASDRYDTNKELVSYYKTKYEYIRHEINDIGLLTLGRSLTWPVWLWKDYLPIILCKTITLPFETFNWIIAKIITIFK